MKPKTGLPSIRLTKFLSVLSRKIGRTYKLPITGMKETSLQILETLKNTLAFEWELKR